MAQIDDSARAERLAYHKAWRAANPERVKMHNENYWRKRAERRLQEQEQGLADKNRVEDADCKNE